MPKSGNTRRNSPPSSRPSDTHPTASTSGDGERRAADSESEFIDLTHVDSDSRNNEDPGVIASPPASISVNIIADDHPTLPTPSGAVAGSGSGSSTLLTSPQFGTRALSPDPSPSPSPVSTPTTSASPPKRTIAPRLRKDSATGLAAGLTQSRLGAFLRNDGASTSRVLGIERPSS
ncbi:unnamed protein product [Cyclocybe aegerita]|uniref:Uncharacterized protein n=1 Tax=Cyclocybe aegerita TaxID=1973307 RepID=A0A8S0WRZ6_CYCAE|nr:unnamed protein product [Cyclocybe aegerita]